MDRAGLRAAIAFLVAFSLGPLLQLHGLERIPGNLDDARLNNYLLENIWLFLTGRSESLWQLPFFSPFPYVVGFSENLFGASPIYLAVRAITGEPDTAFQLWHFVGYIANYVAAYGVLRRFGRSADAACLGALVFTFALPVSGQTLHAQLAYRFAVPLALGAFAEFLEGRDWRRCIAAGAWLTWQFYCNLYLGAFTLLFLACAAAAWFVRHHAREELDAFARSWRALAPATQRQLLLVCVLLAGTLALLFYPYWRVAQIYHLIRPVEEIAPYLPRLQSYLIADASWLWSSLSRLLPDVPWRWEHQLFVGALPLLLALAGAAVARRKRIPGFAPIAGALPIMIALTLSVGGYSVWLLLLSHLPLFSGMRAIARVDLVLLFPVAYLCAIAIDAPQLRRGWIGLALVLMVAEFSAVSPYVSEKQEWRDRLAARVAVIPEHLPEGSILFFAQNDPWGQHAELDAMWAARARGFATLNGYSGFFPPHFQQTFGASCDELPNRIGTYQALVASSGGDSSTSSIANRIVPIGFEHCAAISPAG